VIRLTVPEIGDEDVQAVVDTLRSGYLVQGPRVAEFEARLAAYTGARHAVAVTNCTAALHLALSALGVERGDQVVTSTYSWPATANVIALIGAEPVFVDIDPRTFNMVPNSAARALAASPRAKALLPVHAFGQLADMPALVEIAAAAGVPVLEDAACALGATIDGVQAGRFGDAGCFSFHPRKAVTTGEGGAVVTESDAIARRIRTLRNHGQDPLALSADFVEPGHNVRLTEMQGALGVTQLAKFDRILAARRAGAAHYDRLFAGTAVLPPAAPQPDAHTYQSYVVLLPREVAPHRAALIAGLREAGIESTIGTYRMPLIRYFRDQGYREGDFPVTDDIAACALTLPLHARLSLEEHETVVAAVLHQVERLG